VAGYDAIRLFVERARDARTDFVLTPQNAAAVVEICWHLDGIPLAIELAAARVRAMSAEQIAARLDDRFRLLNVGSRTALPRQQTLRASIDWSYDLLSEAERTVFQRLAIFAGSFTLDAAEAVCGDEAGVGCRVSGVGEDKSFPSTQYPTPDTNVLDLLARLVEKSLVVAEPGENGMDCYRLLETLREYARERLAASGEAETVARRHAETYLALAEAAAPELHRRDQVAWLDRLEREQANLRAALDWLGAHDRWVDALRLATALGWFWIVRGHYAEGRARLSEALDRSEGAADAALRCWALRGLWYLASRQGDFPATERYRDAFLGAATDAGDSRLVVEALALNGTMLRDIDPGAAERELRDALTLARDLGFQTPTGPILVDLGVVTAFLGDLARSESCFTEGLAALREAGDVARLAFGLNLACMIGDLRGDYRWVRALAEEYGPLARALGDPSGKANCWRYLARVAWWEGDLAGAEALNAQALAFYRGVDDRYGVAWAAAELSRVCVARGDLEQAQALAAEGLELARGMNEHLLMRVLRAAGDVALARGEVATAAACYREGLALLPRRWVGMWRLALIEGLAKVAAAEGRPARALRLAGAAAADRARLGVTASPIDQDWLERALAPARDALSEAEAVDAYAEGEALTLAEATAYALEEEGRSKALQTIDRPPTPR
jgi:predicted ATPase